MKKFLLIPLMIVLVSVLVFSGSAKVAPAAPAKPIEMSWATGLPPFHGAVKHVAIPWTKMISERTNGRVKITVYPGAALCKDDEVYPSVVSGIVDIGPGVMAHYPGRFPLSSVFELPLLGFTTANDASKAFWKLYQKFPEIRAEYSDVHVLWLKIKPPFHIQTVKKPVRTLGDLKGLKLRCIGGTASEIMTTLGAVPVVMPAPDTYLAMEKGVVDGSVFPWEAMQSFKLYELINYHTVVGIFSGPDFVVMNLNLWNSLPTDIQKVFNKLSGAWGADFESKVWDEQDTKGRDSCVKAGNEISTLPPKELERWKTHIKPMWDKWVAGMEAKGLPGRKVLNEVLRLSEEYAK